MSGAIYVCGPAKGTKAKPYRCICCRVAFKNPDALGVSICWDCQSGKPTCANCRERGVPFDDFRVGKWEGTTYHDNGGRLHRLARLSRTNWIAVCGARVPKEHIGQGISVVPAHRKCWPKGYGY